MEIQLRNIGVIQEADIRLDGLTVITGKNETGKSTVGKALYALIDGVSDLEKKAEADREDYIWGQLQKITDTSAIFRTFRALRNTVAHHPDALAIPDNYPVLQFWTGFTNHFFYDLSDESANTQIARRMRSELKDYLNHLGDRGRENAAEKYYAEHFVQSEEGTSPRKKLYTAIPSMAKDITRDIEQLDSLLESTGHDPLLYAEKFIDASLHQEFYSQIQHYMKNEDCSGITIWEEGIRCMDVAVQGNRVVKCDYFKSPADKVFFLDDPFIMDKLHDIGSLQQSVQSSCLVRGSKEAAESHTDKLIRILSSTLSGASHVNITEQMVLEKKLKNVREILDTALPGTFDISPKGEYYITSDGFRLRIPNLATGSKMFSMFKILLDRGLLDESAILILDEPETYLHPQWQNQFAEIIVLLVKELHVKVLLTTHSSNFMLAVDAYMRKYGINKLCNFYHAERLESGIVRHECVNDNMNVIYEDFVKYLSNVNFLRSRYDIGGETEE